MFNIVIFGKPGSGKGTQANFLKEKYNLYHISTGDLFRKNISNQTKLGVEAKSYLDNGDLVPDSVTIKMLENEVLSNKEVNGYIFDGFPPNSLHGTFYRTSLLPLLLKDNHSVLPPSCHQRSVGHQSYQSLLR